MKTLLIAPLPSLAVLHTVRISTYSFSSPVELRKYSVIPLLRVGRTLIKIERQSILKSPETAQVMLHRTLMALIAYTHCCKKMHSNASTRKVNGSVSYWTRLISSKYSKKSIQELCTIILEENMTESVPLMFCRFPSTFLIDSSLDLRDLVYCLHLFFESAFCRA